MKPIARDEAIQKLKVARHRLQSALDRFYSETLHGDRIAMEAAALDSATSIRVMVHTDDSLLGQLDSAYLDKLIHFSPLLAPPTTPEMTQLAGGRPVMTTVIPVNLTFGMKSTNFTRYKGNNDPNENAPLRDWWLNPCWDDFGHAISNKDLVLGLANKEGGAHVDGDMSAKYKAAKEQGRIVIGGTRVSDVVRLGNLVGIAGDELLEYLKVHFPESN
jgi:hypothetical protein